MPTQEERQRIVLEFLTQGNPQAAVDAINAQTEATKKLTAALEQTNQAQQQHDSGHTQRVQKVTEQTNVLGELNKATYNLSAGIAYSGLGWQNFASAIASSANGIAMTGEGISGLAASLGTLGIVAGGGVAAIGAIGLAIQKTTQNTIDLTSAITKLSEQTSISLSQLSREFSAFSSMFGSGTAAGVLGSIGSEQANLSAVGIMQQLSAQRAAAGNANFWQPLYGGLARMGVSTVLPGSTMFDPKYADPQAVLLQVANRLADVTDPNKKLLYNATVEQSLGKDVAESANLLAREMQYSRAHGGTDADVVNRLKNAGMMGFNLSPDEQHDVDEMSIATNEFHQALTLLLADLGNTFLPALTQMLRMISAVLHIANGQVSNGIPGAPGAGGIPPWLAPLFPGGPLGAAAFSGVGTAFQWLADKLPHHASGGAVPAGELSVVGENGPELWVPSTPGNIIPNNNLSGLSNLLGMIPNIGNAVSQTLRDITGQIDAIGGAAGLAARPAKDFIGDLTGLLNAWKGAGWVQMQQEVLEWGQQVGAAITTVIGEISQLESKLAEGMPRDVINFVLGAVPQLPTLPNIDLRIVPQIVQDAVSQLLAEGGPYWELTHDRSMSVVPTVSTDAVTGLLAQGGPYWQLTHDRSVSIIPTIDTTAVMQAISAIPTTINIGVKTVPVTSTTVADNTDRAGAGVTANAQSQVGMLSGTDWQSTIYNQAASVYAQTGVDPAIIATIGGTETGSSGKSAGDITLGITSAAVRGGAGSSGMVWSNGNTEGGRQPARFFAYQNGAEAAQAFKDYIAAYQPQLLPLIGDASKFFDPNGPISTSNYYVPTGAEAARAGSAATATFNYYANWLKNALGLQGSAIAPGPGVQDPGENPRYPNNGQGAVGGDLAVGMPFGASISTGGGGGPPSGDLGKAVDDLKQKLQDGTATVQDFVNAWSIGDPVIRKLFQDIQGGQDPVQAMNTDLSQLGDIATMNLGDQLPQAAGLATQAIQQLGDAGVLDLGTGLPTATQDTINAFASMNTQAQAHFSTIENALNTMTNTAVVGLGSDIPGASQDAGGSMNLPTAVTQDLKSKGLDPSNVSVGDLTDSLTSLGQGIPSLNPIIQSLIDKLNAIPRDVNVNITTSGGGSAGGPPPGDTSPGSSGPGGRNNNMQSIGGSAPAPGQGFNGSTPSPPALNLGGGGGGGVRVMAEGGILDEPVSGIGLYSGMSYLMGEAGPEAVVPLNGKRGGNTVNIFVNVAATDFSDPQHVTQMAKVVSDQIARNIRVTGSGRQIGMAI